jgi:hypothetical protein
MGNAFDEVIKLQLKWKKKGSEVHKAFREWREIWKAKGPVEFAEQILRLDPETGNELKLSDEQKVFLNDLAFNGVRFAIAIAGRGGGKTFVIACYVAWRIYTHEHWGIATIGGSKEQTAKIRKYMAYWITKHDEIAKYTLTCTKDTIETHCNSYATFNPCFTGDTVVYGDYNTKFSDLDVNNSICSEGEKINPNILIITQYSGELIKIKPMGLLPIKCTPEHPIYVTNFKKYKKCIHINGHKHYGEGKWTIEKIGSEMKIAKELNTKDYLMIPRKQSFNTFNNEELAWLLGAYLAKGWIEKKFNPKVKKYYESVKFGLGKHETDFINKIYELSNKYFKTGSIDNKHYETATKISLYKKGAVNFFKTCGTSSKNKHIALFIKDANPKIVRAFIEGYLEGDGNTTHKDSLRISTTTEQIIYDLIEIFTMNLGILPNVYVEKNRENTIICGRTANCKQAYELLWSKDEWYNNCRKINVWYKDEQYVYVPIKNIEKEYVDNIKVYNLNVPKTNTYCVPFIVHNCSEGGSRGAHVTELIIDEAASADKVGKTDIILSAKAQVSTSPDIRIVETSTAQTISGDFYDTWRNAEAKGYKRYTWSLAKHISGNKNIYEVYKDRNPKNWKSNVPWVKDQNIEYFRREYNDDKFLVEILGGIGKSSGLVFAPEDIEACVCKRCIEEKIGDCKPYEEGYCPLIQYYMNLSGEKNIPKSNEDALRAIQTRVEGIDWGRKAPSTYVAVGKYKNIIFVLDAQEVVGVSDSAKIQKAINIAKEWKINVLRPDPREWAYNNTLRNKGFTVHELWTDKGGEDKYVYLYTLQRFIEHHSLIIPYKFKGLIDSLKNLTYTDDGKIAKKNDHYADGCLYAVSYYGDFEGESLSWVEDLEKEKLISNESNIDNEENKEKTGRIENFEEWYLKQKKKYYNPNNDSESDFPWGIGSSVW